MLNSGQLNCAVKNRERTTNSYRNNYSEKYITTDSPVNGKNQADRSDGNIQGLKNKLGRTISTSHASKKKFKSNDAESRNTETEFVPIHNQQDVTCFEVGNDSTESEGSLVDSENELYNERSTNKKEKQMRKIIKRCNADLFLASGNGNLPLVRRLLFETKPNIRPDINYRGPDFKTPLYNAASEGFYEVVEFLLENGAQIDTRTL